MGEQAETGENAPLIFPLIRKKICILKLGKWNKQDSGLPLTLLFTIAQSCEAFSYRSCCITLRKTPSLVQVRTTPLDGEEHPSPLGLEEVRAK